MRARRDTSSGADPQGAVARAETYGADHYDPIAEARLVERARIVRWLRERANVSALRYHTATAEDLDVAADLIDEGAHLDEVKP